VDVPTSPDIVELATMDIIDTELVTGVLDSSVLEVSKPGTDVLSAAEFVGPELTCPSVDDIDLEGTTERLELANEDSEEELQGCWLVDRLSVGSWEPPDEATASEADVEKSFADEGIVVAWEVINMLVSLD
jgi:hypothetical protein